jgi:hypothetical protein
VPKGDRCFRLNLHGWVVLQESVQRVALGLSYDDVGADLVNAVISAREA